MVEENELEHFCISKILKIYILKRYYTFLYIYKFCMKF